MKFRVLTPIRMNRREYRPGDEIELTEEQAGKMPWAVEDPQSKAVVEPEAPKMEPEPEVQEIFVDSAKPIQPEPEPEPPWIDTLANAPIRKEESPKVRKGRGRK